MTEDPPIEAPTEAALYLHRSLTALNTLTTAQFACSSESPPGVEDRIADIQELQKAFLTHFTHLLLTDAPRYNNLSQVLQLLSPPFINPNQADWNVWEERLRPVLEAIIAYVSSLRTRQWERDADRHPSVLPDAFPLRLWCLPYPNVPAISLEPGEREQRCKHFADQISVLTNRLAGTLYHRKLKQIKEVLKCVDEPAYRARVACYLGDVRKTTLSWLSMQDLLRVEVAAFLLEGVDVLGLKADVTIRVKELVQSWRTAEDEGVRLMGWAIIIPG